MSNQTLTEIVQNCGIRTLLDSDCASAIFTKIARSSSKNYLGISLMGEAKKTDSMKATLRQYTQSAGVPLVTDDNSRGAEIDAGGFGEASFELVGYKETRTLHADEIRLICEAERAHCSLAQTEQAVNVIEVITKELVDRYMLFREKPFWEGVFGQINYETQAGTSLTVNTGTNVMPSLAAADYWTNSATSTPIEDIEAMVLQMRDTGHKPAHIIMNAKTYAEFLGTGQVLDSGAACISSCRLEGAPMTTLLGMTLHVYDGFYTDSAGNTVRFIPDGQVVVLGSCGTSIGAKMFHAKNIDDRAGQSYGGYLSTIFDDNPRQDAYFMSFYGAPVFTHPLGIVTQQVF